MKKCLSIIIIISICALIGCGTENTVNNVSETTPNKTISEENVNTPSSPDSGNTNTTDSKYAANTEVSTGVENKVNTETQPDAQPEEKSETNSEDKTVKETEVVTDVETDDEVNEEYEEEYVEEYFIEYNDEVIKFDGNFYKNCDGEYYVIGDEDYYGVYYIKSNGEYLVLFEAVDPNYSSTETDHKTWPDVSDYRLLELLDGRMIYISSIDIEENLFDTYDIQAWWDYMEQMNKKSYNINGFWCNCGVGASFSCGTDDINEIEKTQKLLDELVSIFGYTVMYRNAN